jgi:CelD/BcsL family acetyltransferase involved in cellulose biosynthesis
MLAASDDPFSLYQSPEWFEGLRGAPLDECSSHALAVRRDDRDGHLIGIIPLFTARGRCRFPLVLGRAWTSAESEMIVIPSGRLLLPPGDHWFDRFFAAVARRHPERPVLRVENIPVPGPLHDFLHASPRIRRGYYLQQVPGLHQIQVVPLPPSYDQFLTRYSAKKRYNLRRQLRMLQQRAGGQLELRRYVSSRDSPELLASWRTLAISRHRAAGTTPPSASPSADVEAHFRRLADLGVLRSYLLRHGGRPIAGIHGYVSGRTFLLGGTIYDPEYAPFSAASALLHMVIEDLIKSCGITLINLGYGQPRHEYRSTNVVLDYASYWLIPKTWKSRLFQAGYAAFRGGVALLKAAIGPRTRHRPELGEPYDEDRPDADPTIKRPDARFEPGDCGSGEETR